MAVKAKTIAWISWFVIALSLIMSFFDQTGSITIVFWVVGIFLQIFAGCVHFGWLKFTNVNKR